MKKERAQFTQVNYKYKLTSKELKEKLGLTGEITSMQLWRGRSPNDIDAGKSPDLDEWEICTREVNKERSKHD